MTRSHCNAHPLVILRSLRSLGHGHLAMAAALGLLSLATGWPASAATITVDASKKTAGNPHFWSASVGTGTASLTLRSDLQTHYKIGNREAGFQRVRGHGVLNDDMGIYKASGSPDFTKFDTYLTAISTANMRPILELDFMPTALATGGDMHSPPSDNTAYKNFIKAVVQHCVDKFGASDVGNWYIEVWNEPDYSGFWKNTDMNAYYTLYDNAASAITSVLPNALVGGPATTGPSKIAAFLQHCKTAGSPVAFASSHVYPGGDGTKTSSTTADASGLLNDNNSRRSQITSGGYTTSAVKSFNTEWNSSYSGQGGNPADVVKSMDNHWNVGFILKSIKLLTDVNSGDTPQIDVASYWVLSDVFDESSGTANSYMLSHSSQPFGQVFGLMTVQGMRKAAFNAFKLLNYLGPNRLSSGGGGSDTSGGINLMATMSDAGDSLQILLYDYNNTLNTPSGSGDSQAIAVSNLPAALAGKEIFVTTYTVDEKNSNPYSVWTGLGSPTSPSESDWEKMHQAQHLAVSTTKQTLTDATFSTTVSMLKQSGMLVILSAKRPLMGRDALVEIEGEDYDGVSGATKEDSGDSVTLGQSISFGKSGDYVFFDNVDFTDDGVGTVQLRVKSSADTTLELLQGSATGTSLGKCTVSNTSGSWATQTCTLSQAATGFSDSSPLYLVAGGALHLNYIKFQAGNTPPPTGGTGAGGSAPGGASGSAPGGAGGSSPIVTGGSGAGASGTARGGAGGSVTAAGGSAAGGAAGSARGGATGSGNGGAGSSGTGAAGNGSGGSGGVGNTGQGGNGNIGQGGGNGNGGSSSSGNTGDGGNPGQGGNGNSGQGGNGNPSSGNGGNSGSGGSSSTAGGGSSGCSCRVGTGSDGSSSGTLLMVGLAAVAFGLRRQRARRCR